MYNKLVVQISKKFLDKELESELFNQLWFSLGKINASTKASDFYTDLLSQTERLMLAKRIATAILITRGQNMTKIRASLNVSFTTVTNVSSWVKNARPETKRLLENISKEKSWEALFDKIDEILDKIPPRRHSDWKEEFKQKRANSRKRLARKSLR